MPKHVTTVSVLAILLQCGVVVSGKHAGKVAALGTCEQSQTGDRDGANGVDKVANGVQQDGETLSPVAGADTGEWKKVWPMSTPIY